VSPHVLPCLAPCYPPPPHRCHDELRHPKTRRTSVVVISPKTDSFFGMVFTICEIISVRKKFAIVVAYSLFWPDQLICAYETEPMIISMSLNKSTCRKCEETRWSFAFSVSLYRYEHWTNNFQEPLAPYVHIIVILNVVYRSYLTDVG